jgi:hypothetical protein
MHRSVKKSCAGCCTGRAGHAPATSVWKYRKKRSCSLISSLKGCVVAMAVIEKLIVVGVSNGKVYCQSYCWKKIKKAPEGKRYARYKCIRLLDGTRTKQLNPDVTSSGMYLELY